MTQDRKPPQQVIDAHKAHKFSDTFRDYYRSNLRYCDSIQILIEGGFIPNPDFRHDENNLFNFVYNETHYLFYRYTQAKWIDGQIEGFTSILELWKGKPVRMNPGKFIRKLFPYLSDSELEKIVADLKRSHSPLEFDLIVSNTQDSFIEAYETKCYPKRSPTFIGFPYKLKRLDSSCMRGDVGTELHPAAAYAGPDLVIVYAKEKLSGNIGARVVAYPDKKTCSFIYTVDDAATQLVCDYLMQEEYKQTGLKGARVSKVECNDGWLMPYVDDHSFCDDIGEYFQLGRGDICCQNVSGFINNTEGQNYCDSCEEYTSDELTCVESGDCVCHYCLSDYVYSDLMGEYIYAKDSCTSGDGYIATERYFERYGYISDVNCEYQIESECVEYGSEYYHESHQDVTCFEGVYYHEDSQELIDAIEVKEKSDLAYQVKTTTTLQWTKIDEYNPTPFLGFVTIKERTLRDNYQLDSYGNPERLPDFLDLLESA
jgi:hypothetical protein